MNVSLTEKQIAKVADAVRQSVKLRDEQIYNEHNFGGAEGGAEGGVAESITAFAGPGPWALHAAHQGYGMCTCGDGLGVFVGPRENIRGCPAGWLFKPLEKGDTHNWDLESMTYVRCTEKTHQAAGEIQACINFIKDRGRSQWPAKK